MKVKIQWTKRMLSLVLAVVMLGSMLSVGMLTALAEDVTEKAAADEGKWLTVSFDTNGGAAIDPVTVAYGEKYSTKLPSSAVTGLSGGDSNWYLVDENGAVTDKITRATTVSLMRDHTLRVVRKVLAPTVTLALTVPGGLSDKETNYLPGKSTRVLTVTVKNFNADVLNYTYAWYKDGTLLDGETGAVLTLDGQVSDSGTYRVVVTATLKDGTGITVTQNSASTEKEQKVTIRHAANTLYFDANGGEGGPSSNYTGSDTITVQSAVPEREGYRFIEWNTAADGSGKSYQGKDSYVFAEDNGNGGCKVTLYAQWLRVYSVYVGGTQITEENEDDLFGDGKVSYDPEANLLTLNGYTYEGDGYLYGTYKTDKTESGDVTEVYSAAVYSAGSLNVEVKGNNTVKNTFTDEDADPYQYGDGIVAQGDLTLIGDGSLSVSGDYGLYADNTITVDGISLEVHAEGDGLITYDAIIIKNKAHVSVQAERAGIYAEEGNVIIETNADVTVEAEEEGIFANEDVTITDSRVTIDVAGDGIYANDGSVMIDSTKTNVSATGPWLDGTKVTITAGGGYGIFAYSGLTVDEKLTVSSPENSSIGELTEEGDAYSTVIVEGAAAKEIVIEPLGYQVTITGLSHAMQALVPAGQSLNSAYCERYEVEDFSAVLNTQKEGYTFGGWYTDDACTDGKEYDFDDPVTADITLYPKWVPVATEDDTLADDGTEKDPGKGDSAPTSPDTGNGSHVMLWIALLLISGGAVTVTRTVYDRKRKSFNQQ